MSRVSTEELERKLHTSPQYREAIERVRRAKGLLTDVRPVLTPSDVSTRGQWELQPEGTVRSSSCEE